MKEDEKAPSADERTDAVPAAPDTDKESYDPDYEAAFNEGADSNVNEQPKKKQEPKLVEPATPPKPEAEPAPEPTADPAKPPEKPADKAPEKPPAEPEKEPEPAKEPEKEPESALDKAEAAGAALQGKPAPKEDPQSVQEQLPPEYADLPDVVQTESFQKWFNGQPKHIQNLGIKGGVDGACAVYDRYRDHTAAVAAQAAKSTPAGARRIMAELGDLEMQQADGSKVKINDYLKDYGDLGEAVAVIADKLADMRAGKPAGGNDRVARLEAELADMRFWESVQSAHSDGKKIARSEAFQKWAKEEASENVRRLAQSPDPEHAILALDAFKEVQLRKAKTGAGGKAKAVAMHADTLRGKPAPAKPRSESPTDFDDGFEAGST